jgi:hypothetical protein
MCLMLACLLGETAMARNIKLINADAVDATDIRSLVASVTRGCRTDREKMVALWAYIARNPYYHWCEARENPEGTTELGVVVDPITAFNVYGTVICYQVVDVLATMADTAGIRTRTRTVPGHMVTEAFYDGEWHLFDAQYDLASYFVADDGEEIISLAELCKDSGKYIRNPKHPSTPFFQFDKYGGTFWPWESKEYFIKKFYPPRVGKRAGFYDPYIARGHTIHLDLHRGETLVRKFTNDGKWYCPADFYRRWKRDKTQRWVDKGPHDPRNPENTYANGELIYEPDWAAAETNFADGLYAGKGYVLDGGEVRPKGKGTAEVIFRVWSPYLIAGHPGRLDRDGDSRDGAVLEAEFLREDDGQNAISISTDNGITWREVWRNEKTGRRELRLDLTNHVEGRYGYLVKATLSGHARLGKLRLRNSLFLSPVPLPRVEPGENRFRFTLDERAGVELICPDLGDAENWRRFFREVKNLKYRPRFVHHLSPTGGEGYAVIEVAAPAGGKTQRLAVHASFGGGRDAKGRASSAEIHLSGRPSGPWRPVWKSDFTRRNDKWRSDRSFEVKPKRPAAKCYLKFILRRRTALNKVRIYAHTLLPPQPLKPGSVAVTHTWAEDGEARSTTVRPDPAGETYTVRAAGKKVENLAVTIAVTNDR